MAGQPVDRIALGWKAQQVDVDHLAPGGEVDVGELAETIEPGRIHENRDGPQLFPDSRERSGELLGVCHVGGPGQWIVRCGIQVDGGDVVALATQPLGDGGADT